jgi:hypothetical protein
MKDALRIPRRHRTLAATACALLALLTLVGGAALAAALEGIARLLAGLATLAAYILLSSQVLKRLPVDWDAWRAPDLELPGGRRQQSPKTSGTARVPLFAGIALVLAALAPGLRAEEPVPAPTPAPSPTPAPTPPPVQFHGLVDFYAAWNPNRPFDHNSFEPGTGTTAQKANELGINLAALDVSLDANPVGFHVIAVAGTGTDVVHANELHPNSVRYIYQASLSYKLNVGRGVLLEAGIQPSHIGFEGFFSKDNWNYTRGYMGEFSPYYQTGIKGQTSFDDHWSGQIWFLNGWQSVEDNNTGKAFGTQVAWAGGPLTITVNTFFGPELPDDNSHWRSFGDIVVVYKATDRLQLAASFDAGRQTRPAIEAASWKAGSLWARYALSDRAAFAARAEIYHDPDNAISGFAQTLWETTLTYELRPHPQLILKLEARYDHSTAIAFGDAGGPSARYDQKLFAVGAVATF